MVQTRTTSIYILIIFAVIVSLYVLFKKPYTPSPLIIRLKHKLARVDSRFINYDIREGGSSYTENKSTVYICTKDPGTGMYYSDNTLLYVCLHECAHVLSEDYGHHEEFNKILEKLIKKATMVGIYNPNVPIPKTYCGLKN